MQGCQYGCNSLGKILWKGKWLDCPIHGVKRDTILKGGKLPDGTNIYDKLCIPKAYQKSEEYLENPDEIFRGYSDVINCTAESQIQLKNVLNQVYTDLVTKSLTYQTSLYLYGVMVDLKPWAYAMQKIAVEKNVSTVPVITVNNLVGLVEFMGYETMKIESEEDVNVVSKYNRLAGFGAAWYLKTGKTYTDYINASLVFVIDNGASCTSNLKVLQGVIEERALNNNATYVISSVYPDRDREGLLKKDCWSMHGMTKLTPVLLKGRKAEVQERERREAKNESQNADVIQTINLMQKAPKGIGNVNWTKE